MALRPFQFAAGVHRDGFKAEVRCLAPERVLPPTRLRRRGSPRFEPLDISLTPRCYCPPASKAEGGIPDRLWPSLVEASPSPDLHRAGWRAWTRVPRCVVRHPGHLHLRGEALILTHSSELLKPTACTVTLMAGSDGRPAPFQRGYMCNRLRWLAPWWVVGSLLGCTENTAPTPASNGVNAAAARAPTITALELTNQQGIAYSLNDAGRIVGLSMTAQGPRGFVWDKGALTKLGTLGSGEGSMAVAVNDRGAVVGLSPTMGSATTGFPHAFLWEKGMLTDLGTLPNAVYSYSVAAGINSRGDIVGSSYTAHGDEHAVLWKNGVAIDLDPSTGYSSSASSINELGQVVGSIGPAPSAFLWQDSVITTLGVLPGANYSNASEINNRGQVVGTSGGFHPDWGYWQHAVIWDRGVATDLGVLSGDTLSGATGINAAGDVVGWSYTPSAGEEAHAFLWRRGVAIDLGVGEAWAINNKGDIVGQRSGKPVLWTIK